MSLDAFQVLEDCPACRVEAAVVALLDPSVAEGVALESSCRMCGREAVLGEVRHAGRRFRAVAEVLDALERWARAEGEPDAAAFCAVNMGGLSPQQVAARVLGGERVETSFDVVAFLFPGMAASVGPNPQREARPVLASAPTVDAIPSSWPSLPGEELPEGWPEELERDALLGQSPPSGPAGHLPPRGGKVVCSAPTEVRALVAVMLADGTIRPGERFFLERFCQRAGYPLPAEADLRPWRPNDLPQPADPTALLDAMIELVHIDRERDGSEWRVVREFARAWGHPLEDLEKKGTRVESETAPAMRRLFRALRRLFVREAPRTR